MRSDFRGRTLEGRRMFTAESMATIPDLGDIPALHALSA